MITPKEAEALAAKHVQEFVNACKPLDLRGCCMTGIPASHDMQALDEHHIQ